MDFLSLGVQSRESFCVDSKSQQSVENELCETSNSSKPEIEKPCETVNCEAELVTVVILKCIFLL